MIEQFQLSERRACRLVGLSRDSFRNPPMACEQTQAVFKDPTKRLFNLPHGQVKRAVAIQVQKRPS
jgi:putative transposase